MQKQVGPRSTTASNPCDEPKPLTGVGARVQRGFANYMQTFLFFTPVLSAHAAGRHGWLTVTGAPLHFWVRLIYFLLYYAAGVSVTRIVAFLVSLVGIVMILIALT